MDEVEIKKNADFLINNLKGKEIPVLQESPLDIKLL